MKKISPRKSSQSNTINEEITLFSEKPNSTLFLYNIKRLYVIYF